MNMQGTLTFSLPFDRRDLEIEWEADCHVDGTIDAWPAVIRSDDDVFEGDEAEVVARFLNLAPYLEASARSEGVGVSDAIEELHDRGNHLCA